MNTFGGDVRHYLVLMSEGAGLDVTNGWPVTVRTPAELDEQAAAAHENYDVPKDLLALVLPGKLWEIGQGRTDKSFSLGCGGRVLTFAHVDDEYNEAMLRDQDAA